MYRGEAGSVWARTHRHVDGSDEGLAEMIARLYEARVLL